MKHIVQKISLHRVNCVIIAIMFQEFVKKYIGLIFIISTFFAVFHHHNDVKQHTECQICVIQSSLAEADTPSDTIYFTKLELFSEATKSDLPQFTFAKCNAPLRARAPPILL